MSNGGGDAKYFCSQSVASGVEGGVDELFKNLCHYHFQVFECFHFLFIGLPLVFFCSLFRFCYRNYGDFVVLPYLLGVSPFFNREEGKCLFQKNVAGVAILGELNIYYLM